MKKLHIETSLLEFRSQQSAVSGNVWLKMEALQPCGSFKARGMGHACQEYVARGAKRLVSSSGGNAGLAVAYAGRKLGVPVVVVPETTTKQAKALIRQEHAEVKVVGESWKEAPVRLRRLRCCALAHPTIDVQRTLKFKRPHNAWCSNLSQRRIKACWQE